MDTLEKVKGVKKTDLEYLKLEWSIDVLSTLIYLQLIIIFIRAFSIYAEPHMDTSWKLRWSMKILAIILIPTVIYLIGHIIY